MNMIQFTPIAAAVMALISLGNPGKNAAPASRAADGSVPAITKASADLPLDKIIMPAAFPSAFMLKFREPVPW